MHNPFLSILVPATALFASISSAAVVVEKATILPKGWSQLPEALDANQPIKYSIALRQPHMHLLKDRVMNNAFAEHMSHDMAKKLSSADPEDADSVMRWLADNGIKKTEAARDWIHVYSTVGETESLLNTKLHHYSYEGNAPVVRAKHYHIPDHLDQVISFVHPLSNFMPPKHELGFVTSLLQSILGVRDSFPCSTVVTPDCLKDLYNIKYKAPHGKSKARLAIAGFLEEYVNHGDVDEFLKKHNSQAYNAGYNFSVELVNGGKNPQQLSKAGAEASLDVEYGMGIGYPAKVTFHSTGGRGEQLDDSGKSIPQADATNEPYLEYLQYLLDKPDDQLPHVVSFSYADDEVSVPKPYAERVCNMMGVLTGRGVTIFGGSGDGGAKGARDSHCLANDGSGSKIYMSTFPATCPYVTSVGAVSNSQSPPSGAVFSTGGFSQYFRRDSWQDGPVSDYIGALDGYLSEYYDGKMRATPDISAVGTNFAIVQAGVPSGIGGTSASTPLVAAMFTLINDARLRAGKKSLGWINGHLYSAKIRGILQDITAGESFSCEYGGKKPGGWVAKKGWDAVTGNGVPNDFEKLLKAFMEV